MPSIHPDYEYDIFISYRQNDNKRDGWVTKFVDALRDELEATIKDPISIYFDENPNDGLLETHQVDASLVKKLKCLVFIPIVSQTYCDETSFAWEHEFLPFVKMAKEDQLGINLTLSNGNVTSRVLPIRIHDLDAEDKHVLEAVLDGPLRAIDFIYSEPGVNSPLKPSDNRDINLEKIDYHHQINKVANALKDIGRSIIRQSDGEIKIPVIKTVEPKIKSSKKGVYLGLAAVIIALLSYWGYSQFFNSSPALVEDVTIAVLAFDDQSPDGDQEWLGDGMADEILNVLAKVNGLQVTGKTSSFSFKGKGLTTKVIGETLNVTTVLEGSVSKIGDKLRITAQLIDVDTDAHIWSKRYDRDAADIFAIVDEVAQSIAGSLRSELSIEELGNIKVTNRVDPEVLEYYLKGHLFFDEYISARSEDNFKQAENMFNRVISADSTYADAYAGLTNLYWQKAEFGDKRYEKKSDSVSNIAYAIDPNNAYVLIARGLRYLWDISGKNNIDSAFHYFTKAYKINPDDLFALQNIVNLHQMTGLFDEAIAIDRRILGSDPLNMFSRGTLAFSLFRSGNYQEAKVNYEKVLELDQNNLNANAYLLILAVLYDKDLLEATKRYEKIKELYPDRDFSSFEAMVLALAGKKEEALGLRQTLQVHALLDMKKEAIDSWSAPNNYTGYYTYVSLHSSMQVQFIIDEPVVQETLIEAKKIHRERLAKYGHLFDE